MRSWCASWPKRWVPRRAVHLTAGLTSRRKTVKIEGLTGAAAEALLG